VLYILPSYSFLTIKREIVDLTLSDL